VAHAQVLPPDQQHRKCCLTPVLTALHIASSTASRQSATCNPDALDAHSHQIYTADIPAVLVLVQEYTYSSILL
jgi:hypothetical protein